ncbi:MAG: wax ester/triacylglycerol synthase family O-acyltransferase, partial [Anaerolineales bacterium]|nr:wax ester/triacylglycerol synthase family O-acyltransferase [Anaerolineales bacterium]
TALPAPGDKAMLQEFVSNWMSTPLDFSKPPWHMLVVDTAEGSILFSRLHHCIGDGIALVQVMLSMTDFEPNPDPAVWQALAPKPKEKKPPQSALTRITKPVTAVWGASRRVAGTVVSESMETLNNPLHLIDQSKTAASYAAKGTNIAAKATKATGKLLLIPPDPKTPLKGKLGVTKRAAWSEPMPLGDVKKIGQYMGGKINDVLLSAMAGALRRYLIDQGVDTQGMNFRATVPVNLRPADQVGQLGNDFGLVFLSLPIGIADPFERLNELRRRMDAIKDSPEAVIALGVLSMLGMTPTQIADQVVNIFGMKSTLVATNVPGPRIPLYFAGEKITKIVFWVPQSGKLGLGISIFSYNNEVMVGVAGDAGLIPDPEAILRSFQAEYDDLMVLVRQVEEDGVG